jgi:hypothetical protein
VIKILKIHFFGHFDVQMKWFVGTQTKAKGYNEKVNGLLNMVQGKEETPKQADKDLLGVTEQE